MTTSYLLPSYIELVNKHTTCFAPDHRCHYASNIAKERAIGHKNNYSSTDPCVAKRKEARREHSHVATILTLLREMASIFELDIRKRTDYNRSLYSTLPVRRNTASRKTGRDGADSRHIWAEGQASAIPGSREPE